MEPWPVKQKLLLSLNKNKLDLIFKYVEIMYVKGMDEIFWEILCDGDPESVAVIRKNASSARLESWITFILEKLNIQIFEETRLTYSKFVRDSRCKSSQYFNVVPIEERLAGSKTTRIIEYLIPGDDVKLATLNYEKLIMKTKINVIDLGTMQFTNEGIYCWLSRAGSSEPVRYFLKPFVAKAQAVAAAESSNNMLSFSKQILGAAGSSEGKWNNEAHVVSFDAFILPEGVTDSKTHYFITEAMPYPVGTDYFSKQEVNIPNFTMFNVLRYIFGLPTTSPWVYNGKIVMNYYGTTMSSTKTSTPMIDSETKKQLESIDAKRLDKKYYTRYLQVISSV
jgi:hypothetical protein